MYELEESKFIESISDLIKVVIERNNSTTLDTEYIFIDTTQSLIDEIYYYCYKDQILFGNSILSRKISENLKELESSIKDANEKLNKKLLKKREIGEITSCPYILGKKFQVKFFKSYNKKDLNGSRFWIPQEEVQRYGLELGSLHRTTNRYLFDYWDEVAQTYQRLIKYIDLAYNIIEDPVICDLAQISLDEFSFMVYQYQNFDDEDINMNEQFKQNLIQVNNSIRHKNKFGKDVLKESNLGDITTCPYITHDNILFYKTIKERNKCGETFLKPFDYIGDVADLLKTYISEFRIMKHNLFVYRSSLSYKLVDLCPEEAEQNQAKIDKVFYDAKILDDLKIPLYREYKDILDCLNTTISSINETLGVEIFKTRKVGDIIYDPLPIMEDRMYYLTKHEKDESGLPVWKKLFAFRSLQSKTYSLNTFPSDYYYANNQFITS
jgi:hypothetical protein